MALVSQIDTSDSNIFLQTSDRNIKTFIIWMFQVDKMVAVEKFGMLHLTPNGGIAKIFRWTNFGVLRTFVSLFLRVNTLLEQVIFVCLI